MDAVLKEKAKFLCVTSCPAGVAKGKLWSQASPVRTAILNCVHCPACTSVTPVEKASVTFAPH